MPRLFKTRRKIAIGSALAVFAAGGVVAYAFFTATGTGTGTGTVGNATSWNVNGGSVVGTLYPDASYSGPDQGVVTGASVTNAATSGYQKLNSIVATISSVTTSTTFTSDACDVADFQFNSTTWTGSGTQTATISPNDDLAPGGVYNIAGLNVVMVDDGTAQDNCQGQKVTVTFNAS